MALFLWLAVLLLHAPPRGDESALAPRFVPPCERYAKGLENGRGNFGLHVTDVGSPFAGSWHLAEDVWLPAGTQVVAVADGIVRYSAFSPTWTDARGGAHWNLGNVIVIEHALDPPIAEPGGALASLCSFYVHLASDRRVAVGDRVTKGQPIGRIGAHRSEENGRYPAHLHFGLHRGAYLQVPPSFERELRRAASSPSGLQAGPIVLRGELTLTRASETSVLVTQTGSTRSIVLSLLVGSTAPKDPPPDIACWCEGYGEQETLAEWIRPSAFLAEHAPPSSAKR
jgi:hypothetical protein